MDALSASSPFLILRPESWVPPVGYQYGAVCDLGAVWKICFGGVTGMDATQGDVIVEPENIVRQAAAAFENVHTLMRCAAKLIGRSVEPIHLFSLRIYTPDMNLYRAQLKPIGEQYRLKFGRVYAPTALIGCSALFNPDALVEYVPEFLVPKS